MDENSHPSQENELIEEDIPGCQLNFSELASYRVEQLKFWLSCRGDSLKNLPTKAACIQRINNYVKNGLKDKITDPTPLNIYSKTKSLKRDHNPETSHDNLVSSPSSDAQYMKGNYWMTNSKQLQWSKSLQHAPIFTIKENKRNFSAHLEKQERPRKEPKICYLITFWTVMNVVMTSNTFTLELYAVHHTQNPSFTN
ncbi:uncharacterized protein LOC114576285 [Exaiptasia diaphana]|uniref:Uncharacterized protein n=1 Tax=Exaiptasia diaphana TaxID=2652724 RepID=A0A913YT98_EXADI|nr:uncharacterized protein LOC114576285 [Exaiptasia diaphana]